MLHRASGGRAAAPRRNEDLSFRNNGLFHSSDGFNPPPLLPWRVQRTEDEAPGKSEAAKSCPRSGSAGTGHNSCIFLRVGACVRAPIVVEYRRVYLPTKIIRVSGAEEDGLRRSCKKVAE